MSSEVYDLLDDLAARGRRLRAVMPGDYKPAESGDPMADVLAYKAILSWDVVYIQAQEVHRANAI